MTKKELVSLLEQFPDEMEVLLEDDDILYNMTTAEEVKVANWPTENMGHMKSVFNENDKDRWYNVIGVFESKAIRIR